MATTPEFKPCKETPFLFEAGRYYHSMFYMPIPKTPDFILGGNVTGLLWGLDDEPKSWRLTYRFRYYNSPDPCDRRDKWHLYVIHVSQQTETSDELANKFKQTIRYAARVCFKGAPDLDESEFDTLTINGAVDRALEIVQKNPPYWMHQDKETKQALKKLVH